MAKLFYFNGRGRGEIIRLTLAAADIEFTEVLLTEKQQMDQLNNDGCLVFQQVPYVEIDGLKLVQTGAIVRYVARKGGLYGSDPKEDALIDMYYEGSRDFMSVFMPICFSKTNEQAAADAKSVGTSRYFPALEKKLMENKGGFLIGKSLTMADIGFLEVLLLCVEYGGSTILDEFNNVKIYYEMLKGLPTIAKFLSGPFRKRPNDEKYITEVKRVLGRT